MVVYPGHLPTAIVDLVSLGAAGGEEIAAALGFVAEEVNTEGELGTGFDAFLVGVGVAGGGGG
ncbi:protein of unknown function [Candidatus Promineifilum breve]|uniref:Uncharacterized protein n=1 Tax=Candidatus Promineifilum breve TaxID=1806508 RepID=A0A160T292_9CHLR|nr:protein of unknown function [Candidatus Promineifilum breve]